MEAELIHRYFEKATALVLASAGVESVEKQALHLLASEAERYARALGANAGRLAEASRRSECTVADIEAAAVLLGGSELSEELPTLSVSSDLKKKLRLSIELNPVIDAPIKAEVKLPQLSHDSIDSHMHVDEGLSSPSKSMARRAAAYPEWLQREIETRQSEAGTSQNSVTAASHKGTKNATGPSAFLASLVSAEEEAREILTTKLKLEPGKSHVHQPAAGPNS